jgi:hypothetical protein
MTIAGLETRTRSLRQEEEITSRKLAELRDANQQLGAERDRVLAEAKRHADMLEEQLRAARERERELQGERDVASRSYLASASAREQEIDRQKRSIIEAEARSDSLLQELNALRQQAQLQRAREQELDDALRSARRELVDERSNNRAGQEQLLAFMREKEKEKDRGMDVVRERERERGERERERERDRQKVEMLEETLAKLRGELRGALQERDALKTERETALDSEATLAKLRGEVKKKKSQ